MTQRRCAICGQPVLWTSAFLFEQEVLMHARCWPPWPGFSSKATRCEIERRAS